jgi:nucleotide-binding universal stress UspA family protein
MKNILLLTDFSKNAKNAIDYTLQFFKGEEKHFYILNVHKTSSYTMGDLMASSPTSTVYDSIIKNPKATLKKFIDQLEETYANELYSFQGICDHDDFISAIKQVIKLKEIDLIIMGTNGATGAKEVIFGSNTLSTIRNVEHPVLVIPENYKFTKPNTILFVTEHDEAFAKKSLYPLVHIIYKYDSELLILTLDKNNSVDLIKEKKATIDTYFKGIQHSFYTISNISADIAIDSFMQIKHVDITAKIINKESFLKRLVSGSSTNEITYKTRVPLLIMHP